VLLRFYICLILNGELGSILAMMCFRFFLDLFVSLLSLTLSRLKSADGLSLNWHQSMYQGSSVKEQYRNMQARQNDIK
jgi:hypothetical protein